MKKLVFATLMCVAAMSTKAQVLTSETVNNVYETASNQPDSRFVAAAATSPPCMSTRKPPTTRASRP